MFSLEYKLKKFLRTLKYTGSIIEKVYNTCYAAGTRLGHLSGVPKVHNTCYAAGTRLGCLSRLPKVYNTCYAAGTRLECLYELPKAYKPNLPVKSILSECWTYNFNLTKMLVPIIHF